MHFGSMLSVFPCIINAQPWRSALPLIGLTAWADVRGLDNSLFTPLHCSERVRDFTSVNRNIGVEALQADKVVALVAQIPVSVA